MMIGGGTENRSYESNQELNRGETGGGGGGTHTRTHTHSSSGEDEGDEVRGSG